MTELEAGLAEALTAMAARRAGISPSSSSEEAVARAARRLLDGGRSAAQVLDAMERGERDVVDALHAALAAGETYFFRHPEQFAVVVDEWLPQQRAPQRVRAWSAGCATGEEAYSLAACGVDVVGTDLVGARIAVAEAGTYGAWSLRPSGPALFPVVRALDDGRHLVLDEVRRRARFHVHNLLDRAPGSFDLIFCRNVFVYLEPDSVVTALGNLVDALEPGGLLVLGPLDVDPSHVDGLAPLRAASGSIAPNAFVKVSSTNGPRRNRRVEGARALPAEARAVDGRGAAGAADGAVDGRGAAGAADGAVVVTDVAVVGAAAPSTLYERVASNRDPVAVHVNALELIERGQHRSAEVLLEDLHRRHPQYLPGLLECALLHERRGRGSIAESLMTRVHDLVEDMPPATMVRGPEDLPVEYYAASARAFFASRAAVA